MNLFGFDLSVSDLWLLGAASVCFGWLFVFWRDRHARYVIACATFRAAIDRELGSVSVTWPDNIDRFLRAHYPALLSAIREFKHYIPWWEKRGFDRAWLCFYCAYPDKWDSQCYHHYFDSYDPLTSSQDEATKKCRELFHANVKRLLSYAKET